MNKHFKESIILSLGGSLVAPERIDVDFLALFNTFIRRHVDMGRRFFIIVGGGWTCRHYQEAATKIDPKTPASDIDWMGIHTTRTNAHLVRTIFRDIARPKLIVDYEEKEDIDDFSVLIGGGWKPGWSTDYCSVYLSKHYGAKMFINMSNIKKIYDKDPKKYADAKPIDSISWKDYRAMVGDKWTPGLNTPFDPIASKLADELSMKVIVLDGKDLDNVEQAIEGKDFVGTIIE